MSEEKNPLSGLLGEMAEVLKKHQERFQIQGEIPWPVEVSGVVVRGRFYSTGRETNVKVGGMVMVRMCDESKATHLGIYLGEFPSAIFHQFDKEMKNIEVLLHLNPAMLVPKLGRIVWGCESFWGPIESEDQLRQITDAEIQDIWYVKALRELTKKGTEQV